MPAGDMPSAEVAVDAALVRTLLAEQRPDFADRALVEVANGWDNVIYRLGDDLCVRLPRRGLAAALVEHEQRWLPELAGHLPLPTPAPVHAGRPGAGYPWSWSVCPWLPGEIAARRPPADPQAAARVLGSFVRALHRPAPSGAPANPFRGVPLADRDATVRARAALLHDLVDADAVLARWSELVDTPAWPGPPVWLHGDLHPANVLVHGGAVAAVIDFGDITSGDPATDLSLGWMLFPPDARATFRGSAGGIDDDTWARARAWAIALALAFLASSADNPLFARLGERTLGAALSDGG